MTIYTRKTTGSGVVNKNAKLTNEELDNNFIEIASGVPASGVDSATLHKSPNAITSMFIYDTSKDSDGGAWTEKCQHTSWYNESLSGKWLGAQDSELQARYSGATVSATELVTNGDFSNGTTGWGGNGAYSVSNGVLSFNSSAYVQLYQLPANYANKWYLYSFDLTVTSGTVYFRPSYASGTDQQAYTTSGRKTFIARPTGTGFEIFTMGGTGITIDNVSVKEVTALNTASGDYFQLTTDGKFYRLWKNLLSYSNTFTSSAWAAVNGGCTFTANTTETTDPFGGNTATKIAYTQNGCSNRISVSIPLNGTTSIYIKGGVGTSFSVCSGLNYADTTAINPLTGAITLQGTNQSAATSTSVGNGWYRIAINKNVSSSFLIIGYGNISATAGDYAYICAAQVEYGTTATTYESKTTDGPIGEVFRGNKSKFPKLAGIIAESGNVTIYDLTEPSRPMWMSIARMGTTIPYNVWPAGSSNSLLTCFGGAVNGKLTFGYQTNGGIQCIDYLKDTMFRYGTFGAGTYQGGIATRHASRGYDGINVTGALAGINMNAISMTVLPDAPIDSVTGLAIPTIAVATNGGISVIKHNGTVVNSSSTSSFTKVNITPTTLTAGRADSTLYYALNPGQLGSSFAVSTATSGEFNRGNTTQLKVAGQSDLVRSSGQLITKRRNNEVVAGNSLNATITNTYNTGYMVGDIRRSYLTSVSAGTTINPTAGEVRSLFVRGAQGAWYDPSDYTTLFEDSAGTTPITTPLEKPVGLMLDKSKGLTLGAELVDTLNTAAAWTKAGNNTVAQDGDEVKITYVDTATGALSLLSEAVGLSQNLVTGKWYKLTFDARVNAGSSVNLIFEDSGGNKTIAVLSSTTKTQFTYTFLYDGFARLKQLGMGTGEIVWISGHSVKELPGNHAYQSTSTSRPLISARYNLLTKTEAFSDAVWAQSASSGVVTKGTTTGTKPDGTSGTIDTITFPVVSAGGNAFQYQNCGQTLLNIQSTFSIYAKVESGTATVFINCEDIGAAPSGGNYFGSSAQTLTTTWQKLTLTGTRTSNTGNQIVMIGFDTRVSGSQTNAAPITIQVWGADLRVANDGVNLPSYQRVNTATDYDYAGFPPYLKFDGTDDSLVTNSIDFSATDKMSVFAGVRKLSDAAVGVVAELSASSATNTGCFALFAPSATATANYGWRSAGSVTPDVAIASPYAAPINSVVSGIGNIASDIETIRVNGAAAGSITTDQGTGNYGNYPLYIGRRGGSSLPFSGRIYSLIVCGKLASASEITSTESYINNKTKAY